MPTTFPRQTLLFSIKGNQNDLTRQSTFLHFAILIKNPCHGIYIDTLGELRCFLTISNLWSTLSTFTVRWRTPLHYAVQSRREKVSETTLRLLSSGADVSARNDQGRTPLYLASQCDTSVGIPYLLAAGAPNAEPEKVGLHHCAFSSPVRRPI